MQQHNAAYEAFNNTGNYYSWATATKAKPVDTLLQTNLAKLDEETGLDTYIKIGREIDNKLSEIKFSRNDVTSLENLINRFFYSAESTYDTDGTNQCGSGRRRSIEDFYRIQKYYFSNPLSFTECADIFFNLDRNKAVYETRDANGVKRHFQSRHPNNWESMYNNYFSDNYNNFYCSTVKRNVFLAYPSLNPKNNTEILNKYNHLELEKWD